MSELHPFFWARPVVWAVTTVCLFVAFAANPCLAQEPAKEAAPSASQTEIDFGKDIKPILERHCLECHGATKEEDFRIDDRDAAMDYIIPGDGQASQLYTVLVSDDEEERMPPPEEGNALSDSDIQKIKAWIDQGAKWPEGVTFIEPTADPATEKATDSSEEAPKSTEAQKATEPPQSENKTVGSTSQEGSAQESAGQSEKSDGEKKPASNSEAKPESSQKPDSKKEYSVWNAIGSLHPALLHLPVGLLIAAGLFAVVGFRSNFVMSDCAYYCLWLGMWGSILACVTGWWFSPMEGRGTVREVSDLMNQAHPVFWHRTSALVMTVLALLLCLFAKGARARDPDDGFLWKLGALLLAVAVAYVGHTGGELTHGKKLYKDLFGLIEQATGWDLGSNSTETSDVLQRRPEKGLSRTRDPEKIQQRLDSPADVTNGASAAGLIE